MIFGIIGENVSKSFTKDIHDVLSSHPYSLASFGKDYLDEFFQEKDFVGINIARPYKTEVMRYLDDVHPNAKAIGCVNTIVNTKEKGLVGYNTDYDSLEYLIRYHKIHIKGKTVAVIGCGATSRTVSKLLEDLKVKQVYYVSAHKERHVGAIGIEELYSIKKIDVIINTTPVGEAPNYDESLVQLSKMRSLKKIKCVIDFVYNPINTRLIATAKLHHIKAYGGLELLSAQSFYSSQIFVKREYQEVLINEIYMNIAKKMANLVIIGFNYEGKKNLCKLVASRLNKDFIDIDEKIEEGEGKSPAEIIKTIGEENYREIESKYIDEYYKMNNAVILCGGGVPTRSENMVKLRQNGIICNVRCDEEDVVFLDLHPVSREAKEDVYARRYDMYAKYQTFEFDNNDSLAEAAKSMEEQFYENLDR